MEEQSTEKNQKVQSLHLIDVSSEDDSLLLTASPRLLSDLQSSDLCGESRILEAMSTDKVDSTDIHKQNEHLSQPSQPSETLESELKGKTGKCNLRKSLAWDNAFFTSAGVLDPEELSSIIEGAERDGEQKLPAIQEDIYGSTESLSTLGSESLTWDAFETELFDDVRASIQKLTKNLNNSSSTTSKAGSRDTESHLTSKAGKGTDSHSTSKAGRGETESHATRALKKEVLAPQGTLKQKPAAKKLGMGSVKLPKEASTSPQVSQEKPAALSGGSNSLLPKPPRILAKVNPMSATPTKRVSLGAHRVSINDKNAKKESVTGGGAQPSKVPGLGNLRGVVPRPKQSLKCNSSVSSSSIKLSTSSSIDSSSSGSSGSTGISSVNSRKQLVGSKSNNPNSSGPISRTLSKIGKSKTHPGNSQLSAYLTSMSKVPSSISPASSISELSIESYSSASTVNQWSDNVKSGPETGSPSREVSENGDIYFSDIKRLPEYKFSQGCENQVTESQSQPVEKAPTDVATSSCSLAARPSGLRMPSPKIGFFDGAKGASRTPKGGVQSLLNLSTVSKAACAISSPKGSSNNTKAQKLQQPIRTVTGSGNINDARNAALRLKPVSHLLREPLNAATRVSSVSRSIKGALVRSPKLRGSFSPKSRGDGLVKPGDATPKGLSRSECDKAEKHGSSGTSKSKASVDVVEDLLPSDIMSNPKDGSGDTCVCVPIQGHSDVIGETPIQSAIKCSDNNRASDLSCTTKSPHGQKNDNAHSSPKPTSETNTDLRIPLAVKNSLPDIEALEKLTSPPLTENIQIENS